MKILYICGTYCPSYGGAEISAHTLLRGLQKNHNAKIRVITDLKYTNGRQEYFYENIRLIGTSHKKRCENIQRTLNIFKPDMILTQLMWSDLALKLGKQKKIATILRVCKIPFNLDVSLGSKYSPTALIGVSKAVKKYIKKNHNRDCKIITPAIDFEKIIVRGGSKPSERQYITMFNPLIRKGGKVFKEIANSLSNRKFAVIYGWDSLKQTRDSKGFSNRLIRRICESLGEKFTGKKLKYVDLSDCHNIKVLKPTEDVWKIYKNTRILLIPSQWEEAFGRVTVEGMVNGIPTLASDVGGLKESIGLGGILIKNYANSKEWVDMIIRLDDVEYYNKISKREKKWVKSNYFLKKVIKESNDFLNKTISNHQKNIKKRKLFDD